MNANDEPRNTGTFFLVIRWNIKVPTPALNNATLGDNPVKRGTKTVAPNIANTCCSPKSNTLPDNLFSK